MASETSVKRVRSPNYPSMSLVEAVQQIQKLFSKIGQHPAPREAIATSIGYSGLHGASATAISALAKYGLLERQGDDYKLSERAMKILAPHSPVEKLEALQEAASEPTLFAELIEHFKGEVPGDDLFRAYLIRKGFAQAAVPAVIAAYRDTMELVTREGGVYAPATGRAEGEENGGNEQPPKKRDVFSDFFFKPAPKPLSGAKLMEGERVVFTHEIEPTHGVRVLASGEVDESMLDALEVYIQLQKKRLERVDKAAKQTE